MLGSLADDIQTIIAQGPSIASNVAAIIRSINPYIGTVKTVIGDPAFPTVMTRVQTIVANQRGTIATAAGTTAPPADIGLSRAVPVLDAFIFAQMNPWAPWAAGLAIVAVIGGIGYRMGQKKASK